MCMCVKSLQSCPTLCNSVYYSPPGSCVHGILQARILKLPFPSLRNLPDPGIKHRYSALQVNSLYQGSPHYIIAFIIYKKKSWLILCTNLTEPQGTQIFGQKAIPVVSLKVFLDETSSWIGRLIFPLQSGESQNRTRRLASLTPQASLVAQMIHKLPAMQETQVQSLGWEDPLEKEMATHSSFPAWRIPWTEVHRVTKRSWTWLSNFHFTFPPKREFLLPNHLEWSETNVSETETLAISGSPACRWQIWGLVSFHNHMSQFNIYKA